MTHNSGRAWSFLKFLLYDRLLLLSINKPLRDSDNKLLCECLQDDMFLWLCWRSFLSSERNYKTPLDNALKIIWKILIFQFDSKSLSLCQQHLILLLYREVKEVFQILWFQWIMHGRTFTNKKVTFQKCICRFSLGQL